MWRQQTKVKTVLTNKKEEDEDLAGVRDRKVVPVAHCGGGDGQEPDAVNEPELSGRPGVTHIQNWPRQCALGHLCGWNASEDISSPLFVLMSIDKLCSVQFSSAELELLRSLTCKPTHRYDVVSCSLNAICRAEICVSPWHWSSCGGSPPGSP